MTAHDHLTSGPISKEFALTQHDDATCNLGHELDIMSGHHHAGAFTSKIHQHCAQVILGRIVETARWFIEQHHGWSSGHDDGQGQAQPLSFREIARMAVAIDRRLKTFEP